MIRANIVKVSDREFKLMLGDHEIGTSKLDCDTRRLMYLINDTLDVAFLEGQKYLERLVEANRIEGQLQMAKMKAMAERELGRNYEII